MNAPSDKPRCSHSFHRWPTVRGRDGSQDDCDSRPAMNHGERLFWGLLLIWSALVIAADGLDLLPEVGSTDGWNWFFLGAGTLSAIGCFRDLVARPRRPLAFWDWAFAGGLIVIGLDGFTNGWIVISIMALLLGALVLIAGERRASPATT